MRSPARLVPNLALLSLALLAVSCSSGGGTDSSQSQDNVKLFTARSELTQASGAADVDARNLFSTLGGPLLLTDGASNALLAVQTNGAPVLFSSKGALTGVTGQGSVNLGLLDQVRTGALQGRILVADSISGNLLVIDTNGNPSLFTTKAKVTALTGKGTATLSLPRELTLNQVVAQDLETFKLLKFDTAGNPTNFVEPAELAAAAGVGGSPTATQWVHGPSSQALYGLFSQSSHVVRVQINGTVSRHVSSATLANLFKNIVNLQLLDLEVDTDSDALLLLLGDGNRGVGVAIVGSDGTAEVYSSTKDFEDLLGATCNIGSLAVLPNGVPVAVDRGTAQVLTFGSDGKPVVVGKAGKIKDTSGAAAPSLTLVAGLPNNTAAVFEATKDLLLVIE